MAAWLWSLTEVNHLICQIEGINHSLHRFIVAQVARAIAIDKLAGVLPVLPARPMFFIEDYGWLE